MIDQELSRQKSKQRLATIFDEGATNYDRIGSRFFSYFGQRLIETFPPDAGAKVLDVATGRGAVLFPAAKCLQNGRIIGIDISPNMINETEQEISQLGLTNAEVCVMDAENLHFSDRSFDCVFCGFGLAFFPQLQQALSEFRRVLIPGGRFATTLMCNDQIGFPWVPEALRSSFPLNFLQTVLQQLMESNTGNSWLEPLALKEALNQAKFKEVEIIQEKAEFVFTKVEEWWTMIESLPPVRVMISIMEQEPKHMEQYRQVVAENLKKNHLQADGYHYTVSALIVQATVD